MINRKVRLSYTTGAIPSQFGGLLICSGVPPCVHDHDILYTLVNTESVRNRSPGQRPGENRLI